MKKLFITILALSFAFVSCEFDKGFEEMNINPAKANQIDVGNKFAWTALQTRGVRYENWRKSVINNSTIIQHISTTAGNWSGDKN